jgi:GxxExxY protein
MKERDPRSFAIIGAAMEVHGALGAGFLEAVYQEALEIEFLSRQIPYRREPELTVHYKGQELRARYRPDFICYDSLVVELKAVPRLAEAEEAQVLNYLKASGYPIGLLLNFGAKSLGYRRFAF